MGSGKSGQQMAIDNLARFHVWIRDREHAKDWTDYWRGDKLSRTDIAAECGFGTAALRQNPALKTEFKALEARLKAPGGPCTIPAEGAPQEPSNAANEASDQVLSGRLATAKASADQRIKHLEEENATLRGANADLHAQLKRYQHLNEHLASTGRLIHP